MDIIQKLRNPENLRRNIVVLWFFIILSVMVVYAFTSDTGNAVPADQRAQAGSTQTTDTGSGQSGTGAGCACCGGPQQEIKGQTTIAGDKQEATIKVQGGYDPNVIEAKKGLPLRLTFARQSTSTCDKTVVFPDLGIQQDLPDDGSITLDIPVPGEAGKTIAFTCGMNMLSGKIVTVD